MIGNILVENGLITEEQLAQALADQKISKEKLGRILVRRGHITDDQLMEVLEFTLGIPRVQISRMEISPEIVKLLPTNMISKHHILPLTVNQGRMTLIMADPLNFQAIDEVRIVTGMDVVPVMASERELESAIQQYTALQVDSKMEKLLGELSHYNYGAVVETETPGVELADDAPVIRMVNSLLKQAVQGGLLIYILNHWNTMSECASVLMVNCGKSWLYQKNLFRLPYRVLKSWVTLIFLKKESPRTVAPV